MIEHAATPAGKSREPAHCVGRGAELDQVRALVHEAVLGNGAALLVGGDRGIGKSRLLRECSLMQIAASTISLRCTGMPLPGADLRAQLADAFAATPNGVRPESAAGAYAALTRLLARKPVLLLVDDVHLADREEWRLIGSLLSLARRRRFVLLATYLNDGALGATRSVRAWIDAGARHTTLSALDNASMELLVRSLRSGESASRVAASSRGILRGAQGNPRLAIELVTCAEEAAPGRPLVAPSAESLVDGARERMGADFDVLQECSVLGDCFAGEWAIAMAEKPRRVVAATLQAARDLGLIVEDDAEPGWFRFRHNAVRSALGASIVSLRRALLHERVVRALEGVAVGDVRRDVVLAEQLEELQRHDDAAELLTGIGYAFMERENFPAAADAFARAAAHLPSDSENWFNVQIQRVACLRNLDQWSVMQPVLREMLDALGPDPDPQRAAGLQFDLFHAYLNDCNREAAQSVAGEIAALDVPGWPDRGEKATLVLAYVYVYAGNLAEARRLIAPIEYDRLTDPEAHFRHLIATAAIGTLHEPLDRTLAFIDRAVDIAQGRWVRGKVLACNIGAEEALRFGDIARCREYLAISAEAAQLTAGDENGLLRAITRFRALAALTAGELATARDLVLSTLGWRDMGKHSHLFFAGLGVAVGMRMGDFALVDALFDPELLAAGAASQDADSAGLLLQGFGDVMVARGMEKELRSILSTCVDARLIDAHAMIQLSAVRYGDLDCAEAAARQVAEHFGDAIAPVAAAHVALAAATLARRRGKDGEAFSRGREAAQRYERLGWRLRQAMALEVCGERAAASTAYEACGARSEVMRLARDQTRKARRAPFGARLTARELEVARLVARGRSNAEIAQALQLSIRTVHHHVEAGFSKLGVRARWQMTNDVLAPFESRA